MREGAQVLLLICSGFALLMGIGFSIDERYTEMTTEFPPTSAVVIGSEYSSYEDKYDVPHYYPIIEYRYTVGGHTYTNNDYTIERTVFDSVSEVEELLSNYTIGTIITIYYNPEQPQNSLIIQGEPNGYLSTLVVTGLFTIVLLIALLCVSIPDIKLIREKDQILKLGISNQIDIEEAILYPESTKSSFILNKEFMSSSDELISSKIPKTIDQLLKSRYIANLFAILYVLCGTILIIGFSLMTDLHKLEAVFGIYNRVLVLVILSVMFGIICLVFYFKMIYSTKNIGERVLFTILYPIAAGFLLLFSGLTAIAFPALFLLLSIFSVPIFLILLSISMLIGIEPNFDTIFTLAWISYSLAFIPLLYFENKYSEFSLKYSNFSVGAKYYDYAFSNQKNGIYCVDTADHITIFGDVLGNVVLINEYSMELPEVLSLHSEPILKVKYFKDKIFSLSLDQTLKITNLKGHKRLENTEHILDAIPISLVVSDDKVWIGTNTGSIILLNYDNDSINLIKNENFSNFPIIDLQIFEDVLYIGQGSKILKINPKTLEIIDYHTLLIEPISVFTINQSYLIAASQNGIIRVEPTDAYHNSFDIQLKNKEITALCIVDEVLYAGTSIGTLLVLNLREYIIEKVNKTKKTLKQKQITIHNYQIEELLFFNDMMYTVSSDGTLKIFHLKNDPFGSKSPKITEEHRNISIIGNCAICKLEIFSTEKSKVCDECKTQYHLDHLESYLSTQESNNWPQVCVVCKSRFLKSSPNMDWQ